MVIMRFFKKKTKRHVSSNVNVIHVEIKTTSDRTYPLSVKGYISNKNQPVKASVFLWEKINNQYLKISDNLYLNTDMIETVKVQALEDLIIEYEIEE